MNEKKKVFFIILAAIAGVGLVLLTIGGVMGGFSIQGNWFTINPWKGELQTVEIADEIKNIEIDGDRVEIDVREEAVDTVTIEVSENIREFVYPEGQTLKMDLDGKRWRINESGKINILIPEGHVLDELNVELAAGEFDVQNITATTIDLEVGVGEGELSGISGRDIEATVDVGSLLIEGEFTGNANLECNIGNLEFEDDSKIEEYHTVLEVGLGSVEINGISQAGVVSFQDNADGERLLEVECNLGNVEIELEE